MLNDFISLFYPQICMACGKSLYKNEYCICTYCIYHLPKTDHLQVEENPFVKLFWGRINIHSAAAYYNFTKGGKIQHLIHQLKYHGQKEIGLTLGKLYGKSLQNAPLFNSVDTIIPIPLHKKKLQKRGYNQSEFFAQGISTVLQVSMDAKNVYRSLESDTQTKKSRFNRWKNVESIFSVKEPSKLQGKHILLVDDVVTTGSTLEACAQVLLQIPKTKVSIVTIAYAS